MRSIPAAVLLTLSLLMSACGGSCGGIQAPPPGRAKPRLATLTPSLTSLVVHLGAQDHLVGVSQHGPQLEGVPVVAGLHPNMEAVLFVEPDIVAIGKFPSNAADIAKLEQAKLHVMPLGVVTLGDLRASALTLGAALKRTDAADAFVSSLDGALAAARASSVARQHLRVLVIYGRSGGSFYSTGGGDHVDDILKALGATNVAAGGPVTIRLSLERITHLAPDTILHVVPDPEMKSTADALAFWRQAAPSVPAVKRKRVIAWQNDHLALNGPDVVGAIRALTRRLEVLPP